MPMGDAVHDPHGAVADAGRRRWLAIRELRHELAQHGHEDVIACREVPIDRVLGDSELSGDSGERERAVATVEQLAFGYGDDLDNLLFAVDIMASSGHRRPLDRFPT